jgi:hypothetical protein
MPQEGDMEVKACPIRVREAQASFCLIELISII